MNTLGIMFIFWFISVAIMLLGGLYCILCFTVSYPDKMFNKFNGFIAAALMALVIFIR